MSAVPDSAALTRHVRQLLRCTRCPRMESRPVSGGPVLSKVILIGQAPGTREPLLGRPFAWTAGKTLFRWFEQALGWDETTTRSRIYFAAVCRCFPGKNPTGGDRVPDPGEIQNCSTWLDRELDLLQPTLLIPVGKLASQSWVEFEKLDQVIGRVLPVTSRGRTLDVIPLPHPSGASTWHRREPGKSLLSRALRHLAQHPALANHPQG